MMFIFTLVNMSQLYIWPPEDRTYLWRVVRSITRKGKIHVPPIMGLVFQAWREAIVYSRPPDFSLKKMKGEIKLRHVNAG